MVAKVIASVNSVVPHVGTWIEIVHQGLLQNIRVVPHVGTWIEIIPRKIKSKFIRSCLT